MACLYNILPSCPMTIKIISGTITSEKGTKFGPGDQIVVFGGGIKTFVSPEDLSLLQSASESDTVQCGTEGRGINSVFVPHNVILKDYLGKTYTSVCDLLHDKPKYVEANSNFLTFNCDGMGIRNVTQGEILELLFDGEDSSHAGTNTLRAKINEEMIQIHDTNEQLNVDSFEKQSYDCTSIFNKEVSVPRIASFDNPTIQAMFCLSTAFSSFVINKYKYAVCLTERLDKKPEHLSRNTFVTRGAHCVDADEESLREVKVEVVKDSTMMPIFALESGYDSDGSKLYEVYLQIKDHYQTDEWLTPESETPFQIEASRGTNRVRTEYETLVQTSQGQTSTQGEDVQPNTDKTDTHQYVRLRKREAVFVKPKHCNAETSDVFCDLMNDDNTNRISTRCGDLGPIFLSKGSKLDNIIERDITPDNNHRKHIAKPCGTEKPVYQTSSLPRNFAKASDTPPTPEPHEKAKPSATKIKQYDLKAMYQTSSLPKGFSPGTVSSVTVEESEPYSPEVLPASPIGQCYNHELEIESNLVPIKNQQFETDEEYDPRCNTPEVCGKQMGSVGTCETAEPTTVPRLPQVINHQDGEELIEKGSSGESCKVDVQHTATEAIENKSEAMLLSNPCFETEHDSTPKLHEMSISELTEFFDTQKISRLGKICKEEHIDGEFLAIMTDEDMTNEPFSLTSFELRKFKWLKAGNIPKL